MKIVKSNCPNNCRNGYFCEDSKLHPDTMVCNKCIPCSVCNGKGTIDTVPLDQVEDIIENAWYFFQCASMKNNVFTDKENKNYEEYFKGLLKKDKT